MNANQRKLAVNRNEGILTGCPRHKVGDKQDFHHLTPHLRGVASGNCIFVISKETVTVMTNSQPPAQL